MDPTGFSREETTRVDGDDGYQINTSIYNDDDELESIIVKYYSDSDEFLGYSKTIPWVTGDGQASTRTFMYDKNLGFKGEVRSDPNGSTNSVLNDTWWMTKKTGMVFVKQYLVKSSFLPQAVKSFIRVKPGPFWYISTFLTIPPTECE